MKHCPACNFSFPDFHQVCDFDGAELVTNPERPSSVIPSPRSSILRRILKSPTLLTTSAILALFLSAILIGYLDSDTPIPPVAKDESSQTSVSSSLAVAQTSEKSSAQASTNASANASRKTSVRSQRALPRRATTGSTLARLDQRKSSGNGVRQAASMSRSPKARKSEVATRLDQREIKNEKQPKLIAIMKTTWNVLKKPFRF